MFLIFFNVVIRISSGFPHDQVYNHLKGIADSLQSFWRLYRVLGYFKSLMLTWLDIHCFLYVLVCLLHFIWPLYLCLCVVVVFAVNFLNLIFFLSDLKVHLLDIIHSSFTLSLFSRSKIILDIIPLFVVVVLAILSF